MTAVGAEACHCGEGVRTWSIKVQLQRRAAWWSNLEAEDPVRLAQVDRSEWY